MIEQHGVPAGRLYLDVRTTRLHIVDIALSPAWRGQGVGTALLEGLHATGRSCGKNVSIFVEKFNPALRLYQRLGFAEIADTDVYLEMERLPPAANPSGPLSTSVSGRESDGGGQLNKA